MKRRSKKTCTVDDCARPLVARGMCGVHYERDRLVRKRAESRKFLDRVILGIDDSPAPPKPTPSAATQTAQAARLERYAPFDSLTELEHMVEAYRRLEGLPLDGRQRVIDALQYFLKVTKGEQ